MKIGNKRIALIACMLPITLPGCKIAGKGKGAAIGGLAGAGAGTAVLQ